MINDTGARDDLRPQSEKDKDWKYEEVAFASLPNWQEKQFFKFFDLRNQGMALSCGANSGAKALGIENHKEVGKFLTFSAKPIYQSRVNAPSGGMILPDLLNICSSKGTAFEVSVPSQNIGETAINAPYALTDEDRKVMETYRAGGYVQCPLNIDTVASITDQDKGVVIAIFFQEDEWRQTFVVNNPNLQRENALRHFVVVTDYTLIGGKKHLIIEDSANGATSINQTGQRLMTEEFFNKRCYGAGYLLDRPNSAQPPRPHYNFTRPLKFGMMNDLDVKKLQNILKYENIMNNSIPSTGNYLQMTSAAVYKWQVMHSVAPLPVLDNLKGKSVGPLTLAKLNEIYN